MKRFLYIALCVLLAASALSLEPLTASAAGKIEYRFKGEEKDKAGYAQGEITLGGVSDGTIKLFWADDKKALDGYYEIAELKVSGGSASYSFGDHTAIPADATKLIAVRGDSASVADAEAVYDIPESKRLKYKSSDANYTFMNYSDIHIDKAHSPFYRFSELHWKKALETAVNRRADFIVTAGDNITNSEGAAAEFDAFLEILADSDYSNPIYEASGNHELRMGEPKEALAAFMNATGLDGGDSSVADKQPYYFVEEKKSGDIFIFMALEYLYSPNEGDEFSDEQLDWLSSLLDKYYGKNRNIFLIEHALIKGYGAGDDKDSYYSVPLLQKHKSTKKFMSIIESHPDLVWISGHTHIALKYGYNYSDNGGKSCHMIHDSSVCCPTILNKSSHSLSYSASSEEEYKDFSEGYFVQVFDDEIIFSGENLYHDKIIPSACYIMENCRSTFVDVEREETEKAGAGGFDPADRTALLTLAHRALVAPKDLLGCEINQNDLELLEERAEELLESLYAFGSYDKYQKLKKQLSESAKDSDCGNAYKKLCEAYFEFYPYVFEGEINVYFANTNDWKQPRVKLWSLKTSNGEGEIPEYIGKNKDGVKVYRLRVNSRRYNQIQFTDGGDEEVSDVESISGADNKLYTVNPYDQLAPYYLYVDDYEG